MLTKDNISGGVEAIREYSWVILLRLEVFFRGGPTEAHTPLRKTKHSNASDYTPRPKLSVVNLTGCILKRKA